MSLRSALSAFALLALVCIAGAQTAAAQVGAPPAGASACSGCHAATSGGSLPNLHGMDAAQMMMAMQEFKSGARAGTIMDRIAKGFGEDEIRAIAAWYAAQKK